MQLRGGLIDANEFLQRVTEKANISDRFRQDVSLTEASKYVYSDSLQMQFFNFYNKGSNVAALLDIRLLELSNGKRGFKEVFLSLLNKFGKNKPFPENQFFDVLVEETYPEIREFINDYIVGTKPLPYKEYFSKLGFDYIEERPSEDTRPMMGLQMGMNDKQELILADPGEQGIKAGLQAGDVFYKVLGEEVTMQTARKLFGQMSAMSIGDTIEVAVKRDGKEVTAQIPLQRRVDRHIFVEMEQPSEQQKFLRDVWQRNL
jgi:predicted metalloprotease with PDZ domain